jgi:hypothetical protein
MIPLPFLGMLRAVPWWSWALGAALAWGGYGHLRAGSLQGRLDRQATEHAEQALRAETEARAEEQRRASAHQEIANESERLARMARDAAVRSAVAGDGLRQRAAAVAARCDPAAAGSREASARAGLLLADVLGQMEAAGRELAAEADRRGIAGSTCERAYQSLTP